MAGKQAFSINPMATLQQTTASRPELPDPKLPLAQTTAQSAAQSFRMGAQMSMHQDVINTAAYVALR